MLQNYTKYSALPLSKTYGASQKQTTRSAGFTLDETYSSGRNELSHFGSGAMPLIRRRGRSVVLRAAVDRFR